MDKCLKKFLAKKEQSEETAVADIKENVSTNTALPGRASSLAAVGGKNNDKLMKSDQKLAKNSKSQLFKIWIYSHHY